MKNLILPFVCIIAVGCGPSLESQLDSAVETHMKATSSAEAEDACRKIFTAEKEKNKVNSNELCEALAQKSDAAVSICEDEIADAQFADLVQPCKTELDVRIEKIRMDRNEGEVPVVDVKQLNFRIPFEIQYRDLSNGYTAITGDTKNKQVILSFDDGPHPTLTKQVAAYLEKVGIRAHFLQTGKNVKNYPEVTRYISLRGHSIGNHSWDHAEFPKLSFAQQVKQLVDTNQIIYQTIGWVDPFFRFPYGATTNQLVAYLKDRQASNFLWSVDSNDWKKINSDGTIRTNAQVIAETLSQLDRKGRGLVLFHDVQSRTIELMPAFLTSLYKKGYKVVMLQPSDPRLKKPILP